ncbi:hypothetical protein [Geomesophilobacter sediminis]|uniref:Uncharacterized protein n=1 Tax=Geomesophilobacter sediminis TaxID=2798584 RepID=A0A8J7LU27_9BACT|nr:hypothetical protein [Geomesophilobacter sediminis]MBJ6724124.1 hypothetical protein [Geomesophilobacter sediminis]
MPGKSDQEIIQAGYEASVGQVYAIFFESMASTQSEGTQRQAEESFIRGVKLARQVRDRALQLLEVGNR